MNMDLRSFLGEARQLGPDFFVSISKPVDPVLETCVIQQKLAAEGRYPAIRMENIKGADLPLATSVLGSYSLLGLALGVDPGQPKSAILQRFRERAAKPLKPQSVPRDGAPVKQVVLTGDDIDLARLPIVHHAENDSGKYITVGVLILRDPDSGVLNAGMYRHEVQGRDKLGCMFNPAHHAGYIYRRCQELNKRMEAVLFIGHHPAALIGALGEGSIDSCELDLMGGLMGEPLAITDAETVDLPVPAFAEIAIEGYLDPANETADGPFAEFTGYYGPAKDPIGLMHITAITMRSDAIYHDLDPAHQEHNLANALSLESAVYDSVHRLPGQGKSAGLAAITANPNLKIVVVVDEDIDIYDEQRVLWAIATTFEADQDLVVIPGAMGSHLNPSSYGEVRTQHGPMNTKMVIDATRPATLPFEERIRPPKDVWDRINLSDYVSET